MGLIGGDGGGKDDAFSIVVLLDGGRQQPADANAVAAHNDRLLLAGVVKIQRAQGFTVESPQLENVADLDAPGRLQSAAALGAKLAGLGQGDVGQQVNRKIPGIVGVAVVGIGAVGAHDKIIAPGDGRVGNPLQIGNADGGGGAGHQAGGAYFSIGSQAQLLTVQGIFQLDFVDFQIAAQYHKDHFAIGGVKDSFQGFGLRDSEKGGQFGDGFDAGGADFGQGLRGFRSNGGIDADGFFGVGGVAASRAGDDRILAGGSRQQEFVGILAADGAAVGFGHQYRQAAAAVDVAVSLGHGLIACVEAFLVGVKAVGVFHSELPHPHQAGPGTGFVAKFGLYLIEDDRQVPVALHIGPDDAGDDFLVGGGQGHGPAAAVLQGKENIAQRGAAAGLFPKFHGLEGRHQQFLAAGGVHFLPDDVFNLAEGAPSQGEVGINPGGDLIDKAGFEQQAVAGGFRFGRVGAQGASNQSGHTHWLYTASGFPRID